MSSLRNHYNVSRVGVGSCECAVQFANATFKHHNSRRGERVLTPPVALFRTAQVDEAGAHIALIGDSVAMVLHGHDTTLPVTVDEMLTHCRAVNRGARRPLLLGDMPFGSYEASVEQAVHTAVRFMKEGQVDAVKLEGKLPPCHSISPRVSLTVSRQAVHTVCIK